MVPLRISKTATSQASLTKATTKTTRKVTWNNRVRI